MRVGRVGEKLGEQGAFEVRAQRAIARCQRIAEGGLLCVELLAHTRPGRPFAGGAASTPCALVPPKPNALTPATDRPLSGHDIRRSATRSGSVSNGMLGLGCEKFRLGGIVRW